MSAAISERPHRVIAPIWRFSSTVWPEKVPRPCGTCAMPSRTMSSVARPLIALPPKRISPEVRHIPESERKVVVLPAPFAPSSVVIPPSSTSSPRPNSTWVGP